MNALGYDGLGRLVRKKRGGNSTLLYPEPGYVYHRHLGRVNKHFFVDGRRVASLGRTWTAPAASESPGGLLLPRIPEPPPWAAAAAYAAAVAMLLGLALRNDRSVHARGTRILSVLVLASVAPSLMAGRPPPASPPLGTHPDDAVFYVTDHLGSTLLAVTSDGSVRNHNTFEPFGDSIVEAGSGLQYLFAGGERAVASGVYLLGSRGYDPETGRFLSPDLLVPDPADPQSFNRYAYALHNPLALLDPSGLAPIESGLSPFDESAGSSGGGSGGGGEGGGGGLTIILGSGPGGSGPFFGPSRPPPARSEATGVPTPNQAVSSPTTKTTGEPPGGAAARRSKEAPSSERDSGLQVGDVALTVLLVLGEESIPDDLINRFDIESLLSLAKLRIRVAKDRGVDSLATAIAEQELLEIRRNLSIGPLAAATLGLGLPIGPPRSRDLLPGALRGLFEQVGPSRDLGNEAADVAKRNRELGEARLRRLVAQPIR